MLTVDPATAQTLSDKDMTRKSSGHDVEHVAQRAYIWLQPVYRSRKRETKKSKRGHPWCGSLKRPAAPHGATEPGGVLACHVGEASGACCPQPRAKAAEA